MNVPFSHLAFVNRRTMSVGGEEREREVEVGENFQKQFRLMNTLC